MERIGSKWWCVYIHVLSSVGYVGDECNVRLWYWIKSDQSWFFVNYSFFNIYLSQKKKKNISAAISLYSKCVHGIINNKRFTIYDTFIKFERTIFLSYFNFDTTKLPRYIQECFLNSHRGFSVRVDGGSAFCWIFWRALWKGAVAWLGRNRVSDDENMDWIKGKEEEIKRW